LNMTFDDLNENERVFLDANIFIYHFGGLSTDCRNLLTRCAKSEIYGFTSHLVIAEVLHRLMIAEAVGKGRIGPKNPVQKLKANPGIVKNLAEYNNQAASISGMNISILEISSRIMISSAHIRRTEGLL